MRFLIGIICLASAVFFQTAHAEAASSPTKTEILIRDLRADAAFVRSRTSAIRTGLETIARHGVLERKLVRAVSRDLDETAREMEGLAPTVARAKGDKATKRRVVANLARLEKLLRKRLRQIQSASDSTGLTTEISQSVQEGGRVSRMFAKLLSRLHESRLTIIRNM